jgi:hypothetical protein
VHERRIKYAALDVSDDVYVIVGLDPCCHGPHYFLFIEG